jgi:hypothetical protein
VFSDLAANSFDGAANATQNAINAAYDLAANSFDGAADATQNANDMFSD